MADQFQSREERRKKQQATGKQKAKKKPGGIIKKFFLTLLVCGIICILGGVGAFAYIIKDSPKLDPKLLKDPIPSKILDKDGNLITQVGAVNRDYVSYNDIPKVMEDAIIATEDYRFYQHHGIDWIRLGGAMLANFRQGFGAEGASTIDEQLVKNVFLNRQKTITRKVQEAWLANQLEQRYTKHQILEMYVNKVWFPGNNYGFATAAKYFYGKQLKDLTLSEAAQLAGMLQSPNNYNPFTNPDLAEKRRNIVLNNMYQHGYITKQQMDEAEKVHVKDDVLKAGQRTVDVKPYDSFIDEVINEVKSKTDFDINTDGLTIYTTLDPKAQQYVYKLLNTNEIINYPDNQFQAGITLLDTKTGAIRAIGGGRNQQQVTGGFNYAVDARRQPGSTIKPILDYGPAIEYLNWGTYQMIDDKPITYSNGQKFGNWDQRYLGPMTIRTALQLSRNSPAVQTLQQVGLDNAKKFANNLGIPLKNIFESYAIGGLDTGVSTLEMAGAYSAFGNNGIYTAPHAVTKIKLRDGTIIDLTPQPKVVMKDSTAFMITDMLKSVLVSPGTGVRASVPGLPIAGKTGTTNYTSDEISKYNIPSSTYVPDAWFTGYTTNFTASIWTGYPSRKTPIKAGPDQRIAQLIFKNLMAYVSQGVNTPDFKMPNSVEQVRIEKGTMPPELASDNTPDSDVLTEYAVKGFAPTAVSDKYTKSVALDAPTNLTAKYDETTKQITLTWDYKGTGGNVQFDIAMDNGTGAKHVTQAGNSLMIPANPGDKYTFTITAISGGKKSDPVTTSIQIPNPQGTNQGTGNANGTGNTGSNGNNPGNNGTGTGTGNGAGTGGNNPGTGTGTGTGPGTGPGTGTDGNNGANNGGNSGNNNTVIPPITTPGNQSGGAGTGGNKGH